MTHSIAMWGLDIGWRGQKELRAEIQKLQNHALRKCTGSLFREKVERIMGVESVDTIILWILPKQDSLRGQWHCIVLYCICSPY